MPVVTCKSTFKDSRQIFRCDTDSGVRDGQNLRVRINRNRNLTGSCVFEGIGQQLFQNEEQPFFIGKDDAVCSFVRKPDFFLNEQGSIFSYSFADDVIQPAFFSAQNPRSVRPTGNNTEPFLYTVRFGKAQIATDGSEWYLLPEAADAWQRWGF